MGRRETSIQALKRRQRELRTELRKVNSDIKKSGTERLDLEHLRWNMQNEATEIWAMLEMAADAFIGRDR